MCSPTWNYRWEQRNQRTRGGRRPLLLSLFLAVREETIRDPHEEVASLRLLNMIIDDDGLGGAGGAHTGDATAEVAEPVHHHHVFGAVEEAVKRSPAILHAAAMTIQKVWRQPNIRIHCKREYALRLGQSKRWLWAARKIIVAWRRYEARVCEAAVAEVEETGAAVAIMTAVEVAEAAEAAEAAGVQEGVEGAAMVVVGGGGAPAEYEDELTCAYCADRPLYENLWGELVCFLHEEETFKALYPSSVNDGTVHRAAHTGEEIGEGSDAVAAPDSRCLVCDVEMTDVRSGRDRKGGSCAFGHAMCAGCTTRYVKETLLPQGTVFWDRIRCPHRKCKSYMRGMSVQRSITDDEELVKRVEAGQLDAAYLVCGERDPSSQVFVTEFTKPCPNCNAATEKNGGCDHMTCTVCKHQYWYSCSCVHPHHTRECDKRR